MPAAAMVLKVMDEQASVMAYDSLMLAAGNMRLALPSMAAVGVPPPMRTRLAEVRNHIMHG